MKFLSLILLMLLTGCVPVYTTNQLHLSDHDEPLPFKPSQEKALVYIVQPYRHLDLISLGGGASDGWGDATKVYLQTSTKDKTHYLGKIAKPLCFYVNAGQYQLKFENDGTPKEIIVPVNLQAGQTYFFGLEEKIYIAGAKYRFMKLTISEGKKYLTRNISSCQNR